MLKIAIRDDDLSIETSITDLSNAYDEILGRLPISFSTIPFLHKTQKLFSDNFINKSRVEQIKDLVEYSNKLTFISIEEFYSLGFLHKNNILTKYIKNLIKLKKCEITLHGVTHRFSSKGAEFKRYEIITDDISIAKNYLESLFEIKVNYFIPPSNSLNYLNFRNLIKENLSVALSGSLLFDNFYDRFRYYFQIFKYNSLHKIISRRTHNIIKIGTNSIIKCETFRINDTMESFLSRIEIKKLKYLVIATHYSNFKVLAYKKEFHKLIFYFENLRSEFKLLSDLHYE
jgi:hypothetical protein